MAVIEAEALAKRFGEVEAVQGISFALEAGERLAYIGPNGAGKSTSIKMLTGILHPTGGTAQVLGLVPWKQRRQLAMRIGTLFGQRSQLWFQLSPRETLTLLGRIYRLSRAETTARVAMLADLLDAADLLDRPVRTLSLGERMRCELAASVLHEPEILFLDEPTIGLDLIAKSRFRDLVLRLNEERSTTIFLTSHDVSDIEQVARRVIVINHGQLIYDDRVSRMRRELLRTRLIDVRFETAPDTIDIEGARLVKLSGPGAKLEVDTEVRSIRAVLDDLLDRYEVADISVTEPPLEDVITHIYGQAPV
jgi:viologen exporter family transport system ATP-binding protein